MSWRSDILYDRHATCTLMLMMMIVKQKPEKYHSATSSSPFCPSGRMNAMIISFVPFKRYISFNLFCLASLIRNANIVTLSFYRSYVDTFYWRCDVGTDGVCKTPIYLSILINRNSLIIYCETCWLCQFYLSRAPLRFLVDGVACISVSVSYSIVAFRHFTSPKKTGRPSFSLSNFSRQKHSVSRTCSTRITHVSSIWNIAIYFQLLLKCHSIIHLWFAIKLHWDKSTAASSHLNKERKK